jgi:hypothetical protein
MTPAEMIAHAELLREDLAAKRRQLTTMGPVRRAHLVVQINALSNRVEEILRTVRAMEEPSGDGPAAGLAAAGVVPCVDPLADVIRQPESLGNLAPMSGNLGPEVG